MVYAVQNSLFVSSERMVSKVNYVEKLNLNHTYTLRIIMNCNHWRCVTLFVNSTELLPVTPCTFTDTNKSQWTKNVFIYFMCFVFIHHLQYALL